MARGRNFGLLGKEKVQTGVISRGKGTGIRPSDDLKEVGPPKIMGNKRGDPQGGRA